ncbi:hypothetical protein [Pseudomonas jessenii]|jgi:hypothetical protein|uniref:hypothetical protein n=1 Tax=Pseudomonas jessenii TaxID=77298 RepID=UPI0030C51689
MSGSSCPMNFTQCIEIRVNPLNVPGLVAELSDRIVRFTCFHSGFIGARIQVSEQQDEVQMQLTWLSKEHSKQALANAKNGEPDLFHIAHQFQASSIIFRTFTVAADVRTTC